MARCSCRALPRLRIIRSAGGPPYSFLPLKPVILLTALLGLSSVPPLIAQSRLVNVSVRSTAGTGADTLIVGFAIDGSGEKPMLVRGIGPTLSAFGVEGAVSDPALRIFGTGDTQIAGNDDWGGQATVVSASAVAGAFSLASGSADAALTQSLPRGTYSVHLDAKSGRGVALVEAYDAETGPGTPGTSIVNLSARSAAGTGANVLTVGFAIAGNRNKTVLIRAIGPGLAAFGVPGTLANPTLTLYRSGGVRIALNTDWPSLAGWAEAFRMEGAFQLADGSRDAALLINLPPGTYTAETSGAASNNIALLEVYDARNVPFNTTVFTPLEGFAATAPGVVVAPPTVLTQARPEYPFELRRAGVTGEVLIEFNVNPQGRVQNAFARSATNNGFITSAVVAVNQWTFRPAMSNGVPVAFTFQVPIVYTLN